MSTTLTKGGACPARLVRTALLLSTLGMLACGTSQPPPEATADALPVQEAASSGERVRLDGDVVPIENVSLDFWSRPWAFGVRGVEQVPLPMLDNRFTAASGPLPLALDDGTTGRLRIERKPCDPAIDCDPRRDCGCFLEDSYWLEVTDDNGRQVARVHFWAAYGRIMLAIADLVDGPGDELLMLRVPNRGSPPVGLDMKIFAINRDRPELLFQSEIIAGHFWPTCAGFRSIVSIDLDGRKPRPLTLRTELGAQDGCEALVERTTLEDLMRERLVSFDERTRQFASSRAFPLGLSVMFTTGGRR